MSYGSPVTTAVRALLQNFRERLGVAPLRALVLAWLATALLAGALGREGTQWSRWAAGGALLGVTAWVLTSPQRNRGLERSEAKVLALLFAQQPDKLAKLERAFRLQAAPDAEVSSELAGLHYRNLLARLSPGVVEERARSLGRTANMVAATAFALSALILANGSDWVVQGYNVLLARDNRAPWLTQWLDYPTVFAKPPAYLGSGLVRLTWESAAALPEGATLSVRGRPLVEGLNLVLFDGEQEVPFVDDGDGALVAHWQLARDAELRVAARFGDVLVLEPTSVQVHALADTLPQVALAGAPRELSLEDTTQLELQWAAADDHQLSQIDLVLRSGPKEERRTLDRPSPGQRKASGGHILYADDPFIEQSFLPVIVQIEARDNHVERDKDPWGKSAAVILKPVGVGTPQLARFLALRALRDELTDILAAHRELDALSVGRTATGDARRASSQMDELNERLTKARERARAALAGTHAGLGVARGMAAFIQGQFDLAWRETRRRDATPQKRDQALSKAVLAVDAGLNSLAHRDAQEVAKALGDVADEAALAARQAQEDDGLRETAKQRLDLAVGVLHNGAGALRRLGTLGADLGLVALADLERVKRTGRADDFLHAELAALHLAARLHRPNPSFGAKGGGGDSVESGNGGGGEDDGSGKASDADEAFDRLARDLAELSQQHADAVDRTSGALDTADEGLRSDALATEAKERGQKLRRAVAGLPEPGEAPSTSRASSALAREHTGAMAHEFDNLEFDDAVESGRRAKSAAEEALRRGDLDDWTTQLTQKALSEIREQLQWATEQRDARQKLREQAAKEALSEVSKEEQELGERARRLASESGQAHLPEQTRQKLSSAEELMRQAAQYLNSGRGETGLALQRQAQRLLEESQPGETSERPERRSAESRGARRSGFGGNIPAEERRKQAEDFRRRVLEGLARGEGGKLGPAVKRYAEGLLR